MAIYGQTLGSLIRLGIQALRSQGTSLSVKDQASPKGLKTIFQQGVLVVAVLNPKVAIFFLAFLPQFVEAGADPVSAQMFLHGSLIIIVAVFYCTKSGSETLIAQAVGRKDDSFLEIMGKLNHLSTMA